LEAFVPGSKRGALLSLATTPPVSGSDGRNLLAPATIPVLVVRELDYVEVPVKKFVIDSLFVLAVVVDEPNAVKPILSAVIANPKNTPVVFAKGTPLLIGDAHDRERGNGHSSSICTEFHPHGRTLLRARVEFVMLLRLESLPIFWHIYPTTYSRRVVSSRSPFFNSALTALSTRFHIGVSSSSS
jgi:hypothetical protein